MLCDELKIPENAFIVGASGTLNWRKAPEIFLQIARELFQKNSNSNIVFVWIGGAEKDSYRIIQNQLRDRKIGFKNQSFFYRTQIESARLLFGD